MKHMLLIVVLFAVTIPLSTLAAAPQNVRDLPLETYNDKMIAAWIGQMAGVGWGGPTEFNYNGRIIPESDFPVWMPETINQFQQDDLYVEMTFLKTLEDYGWTVAPRQAGIDFANSEYQLWHANKFGRRNLRQGIAPPDSGHPKFNGHADDIDYQIEADFSGIIAPGMPTLVVHLGQIFGRLMNYGDGLYGGLFVGAMYAEAFFENSPVAVVEAGLRVIPTDSQYYECISDVLQWHKDNPDDWEKTWKLINEKYHLNPEYRLGSCSKEDFNIDAKINGAYIVMGLLYGNSDPDKTIEIATRCGQDSDCNPSNAAGILFTMIGYKNLPEKFTSALNRNEVFSHTAYNFDRLVEVCEALVVAGVKRLGGTVEADSQGNMVMNIPIIPVVTGKAEKCWEPTAIANTRFTDEEMSLILFKE
jgi:hypothetical protein